MCRLLGEFPPFGSTLLLGRGFFRRNGGVSIPPELFLTVLSAATEWSTAIR